jgi:site-specific recombinase XerD
MFKEYENFMSIVRADKSKHTVIYYKSNLDVFFDVLGISSVENIKNLNANVIREYMNNIKSKGLKDSSVNARMRVVKAFINWLIENNYLENNPMNGVHAFKETKKVATILTKEERNSIILSCGTNIKLKLMMAMMLYTGMRREEITNIKVEDIRGGRILIHGKGRKERSLVLNEYVVDLLENYLAHRDSNFEYLFYSRKGFGDASGKLHKLSSEAIRYSVKKAARLAGIDEKRIENISAHSMRRTFACDLARNGASSFQIQKSLGHANISTTSIYLEPVGAEIADNALMKQEAPVVV